MRPGVRSAVYDRELNIEAYSFDGVVQEFPNHVHDYYVIGLIERGRRRLVCMGREYEVSAGDVMVFNPGDGHACTQLGVTLQYRALNIPCEVMLARLGRAPRFAPNVLSCACGERDLPAGASEVERAREYIELNFAQHVALDDICREVGMSKSALHRAFTARWESRHTANWRACGWERRADCWKTALPRRTWLISAALPTRAT